MTTDLATYSEILAPVPSWTRPDPVRSRVKYEQPLTNFEILQAEEAKRAQLSQVGVPPPDTGRPRRPHPGDIVYWVATLGGACLLLLCATT
jgi:hypothetical protein